MLVRNIKSDQPTQSYAARPERKERRKIGLHCAAREFYVHQAINNQTKTGWPSKFQQLIPVFSSIFSSIFLDFPV